MTTRSEARLEVRLSRANIADATTLASLDNRCFAAPWSRESIASELSLPTARAWLALSAQSEPVGYVIYRLLGEGEAELLRIAVIPEARRGAIATRILTHSLGHLEQEGATIVHLEVATGNLAALRLYETLDFRRVGRRPGYYGSGQDAELLRRGPDATT